MKENIAVIFGGKSTEHDISILTALQVMENLNKSKYNIIPIYITKQGKWFTSQKFFNVKAFEDFSEKATTEVAILPSSNHLFIKRLGRFMVDKKIDCAILSLHGKNGEDGSVQGLMELSGIPYSSSGIMASSLGMSKLAQKIFFEGLSLPIIPYFSLTIDEYKKLGEKIEVADFSFPVVVKPNRQGSSIGISFCKDKIELKNAIDFAFKLDDTVIIEQAIVNLKEVNISVMKSNEKVLLSQTEQPQTQNHILTFADKYIGSATKKGVKNGLKINNNFGKDIEQFFGIKDQEKNVIKNSEFFGTEKSKNLNVKNKQNFGIKNGNNSGGLDNLSRKISADIDENQKSLIEQYAKEIYEKMECDGVIRIDFIIDKQTEQIYINEVNTIPGSFAYYLWEDKGIAFEKELDMIIEQAKIRQNKKDLLQTTFESNVLKNR